MKNVMFKQKVIASILSIAILGGCGSSESDGSDGSSSYPQVQEVNNFLVLSSDKAQNTLNYTRQLSKFVDDLEVFKTSFLSNNSYLNTLEVYQKAYTAFYSANFATLSTEEKESLKTAYITARTNLEDIEKELILKINQLVIDEVNLDLFSDDKIINKNANLSAVKPQFIFTAIAATISITAGAKALVDCMSSTYPPIVEGALKTEKGRKFVIETFTKNNVTVSANATASEIMEKYNSLGTLSYYTKKAIGEAIDDDIAKDIYDLGTKYTPTITDDLLKSKNAFVDGAKKSITNISKKLYPTTIGDVLGNLPVLSTIKGAVDLVGDIKYIANGEKKIIKTISSSTATTTETITKTETTVNKAKSTINTLSNKNGLDKVNLRAVVDSYNAIVQNKAKNDGDSDDTKLTSSKKVITQSNQLVKNASILESNLTIPTSDMNESFNIISIVDPKQYELNASGSLPNDLVLDKFENVTPNSLETSPLIIVSLAEDSAILSAEKLSEDVNSIKYRVTAVIKDIYKNTNIYLEIFDGSAVMSSSSKQVLNNTTTHIQTVTWDIDVLANRSTVMKLTRSDDISYSDYISLSGKTTTPPINTIVGNYTGTYTITTDDPANCFPKGTVDTLLVSIDANNVVTAQITLGGTVYTDRGISVNSNIIVDDGAGDDLAWSGNILGDIISGTFQDLEDGCNGNFSVTKN